MDVQHGPGLSPWGGRQQPPSPRRSALLFAVRYVVPLVIFVAGLVVLVATPDQETGVAIGFMFFGAAAAVFLLNVFFRMGVTGDQERDREEQAREYFDRHGRWPGGGE
jgi:hypothetical protein